MYSVINFINNTLENKYVRIIAIFLNLAKEFDTYRRINIVEYLVICIFEYYLVFIVIILFS